MKNLLTIILLTISYLGFSQSFTAGNKSMQVPRYANQAAITTAIPTPVEGMLVFNNALDQFAYHNGTSWINFPSPSGGGGTTYTSHVPINTYANATAIGAIASPVEGMIVFNSATNEVFYRSASAWAALPFTSSPWVISGNNISFIGVASNGTSTNGAGTGYVVNGGFTSDTDAAPSLHVNSQTGSTNVIRYDGGTNNAFEQVFTHSTTPANASVEWNHRVISPASTTPMMKLQGDGDLMISGFVGFGEAVSSTVNSTLNTTVTVSNPAVKMRLLTGTINATTMIVPFGGIDPTKIVSVRSMIFRNNTTPNQYVAPGAEISGTAITGNYSLTFTSNPASSGAAGFKLTVANTWINNTYKIFVMFTE